MTGEPSGELSSSQPDQVIEVFEHPQGRIKVVNIEGTERILGSAWVGAEDKQGGKTEDSAVKQLPSFGFDFIVDQRSQGYTGVDARAAEGYKVEVLRIDEETKAPSWVAPDSPDSSVTVASDRGNMHKLSPGGEHSREEYGNPGVRAGIIRVTSPDGSVKHFALGAKFEGRPDNWRVNSAISQVKVIEETNS